MLSTQSEPGRHNFTATSAPADSNSGLSSSAHDPAIQVSIAAWHVRFPGPMIADAIPARLVHNFCRLTLRGASQESLSIGDVAHLVYNQPAGIVLLRHVHVMIGTPGRFGCPGTEHVTTPSPLISSVAVRWCRCSGDSWMTVGLPAAPGFRFH